MEDDFPDSSKNFFYEKTDTDNHVRCSVPCHPCNAWGVYIQVSQQWLFKVPTGAKMVPILPPKSQSCYCSLMFLLKGWKHDISAMTVLPCSRLSLVTGGRLGEIRMANWRVYGPRHSPVMSSQWAQWAHNNLLLTFSPMYGNMFMVKEMVKLQWPSFNHNSFE